MMVTTSSYIEEEIQKKTERIEKLKRDQRRLSEELDLEGKREEESARKTGRNPGKTLKYKETELDLYLIGLEIETREREIAESEEEGALKRIIKNGICEIGRGRK